MQQRVFSLYIKTGISGLRGILCDSAMFVDVTIGCNITHLNQ